MEYYDNLKRCVVNERRQAKNEAMRKHKITGKQFRKLEKAYRRDLKNAITGAAQ